MEIEAAMASIECKVVERAGLPRGIEGVLHLKAIERLVLAPRPQLSSPEPRTQETQYGTDLRRRPGSFWGGMASKGHNPSTLNPEPYTLNP